MTEDFSKVFTVEVYGDKGWEVIGTHNSMQEAIRDFRSCCMTDNRPYRLTSPTDSSIYE